MSREEELSEGVKRLLIAVSKSKKVTEEAKEVSQEIKEEKV